MQIKNYKEVFNQYFESNDFKSSYFNALDIISNCNRIFFIGNGGSNAICSHMMEDFAKMGRFETFSFSDPALITCYANDYGYDNALKEWLRIYLNEGDVLIAISSSGNSDNIINAVNYANEQNAKVITLSGFKPENKLVSLGNENFHIASDSYGIVECFHQVILHAILDEYCKAKN